MAIILAPSCTSASPPTRSRFRFHGVKAVVARLRSPTVNDLRLHNSLQPISRLPEDLLCKIFAHVIDMTAPATHKDRKVTRPRDSAMASWSWVLLTHVCHQWRTVALNEPRLWRHIDFTDAKWHHATSQRAKMQPLLVRVAVERHNIKLVRRTLQLAHLIDSIEIKCSLHHIHDLLSTLAHPNPNLRSMTVQVDSAGHGVGQDNVYDPPAFPIVGPLLPEMKYLELHSAPFYLVSARYASLTTLHLSNLTPCERPTLQHFLFALSRYPHLQHLTLDNAFPLSPSSVPFPHASPKGSTRSLTPTLPLSSPPGIRSKPPSPPPCSPNRLRMARLATLSLLGNSTDIAAFLEAVILPPTVQVSCTVTSLADWQQSMPKLGQALRNHAYANSNLGYTAERLLLDGVTEKVPCSLIAAMVGRKAPPSTVYGARIRMINNFTTPARARSPERGARPASPPSSKPRLWMDLTIGPDTSDPAFSSEEVIVRSLASLWSSLPLSRIHTLALRDFDIVTQKTWTTFLKDLPSLRRLDVLGNAPSGFVWALLLNAQACMQRDTHERERREKRQRKALRSKTTGATENEPMPPPTSPLSPVSPSARKVFVPNLTDVYLNGMDCSSGGYMTAADATVNSYWDLDDSRFLDVLLACLQLRSAVQNHAHPALSTGTASSPTQVSKLRSLAISDCKYVSRSAVIECQHLVSHLVWDQRGMIKDEHDIGGEMKVARYGRIGDNTLVDSAPVGHGAGSNVRHFNRLQALLEG
ncbi:hypothetical protein BKA70DRAFT_555370 [Coprinopsis sp. MPI-PUGE-AT-0042]|nr:hypothetical protein BKA70DRAFT_555370 [Coprinopsis sp. MPI-PUGE-AT-0042]